jgi:2-dehydro-3-deoxygalactonokinase
VSAERIQWIAVDWGTSTLRVWLMGARGAVLAELTSDAGMGSLEPSAFEGALLALVGDHLPEGQRTPVICCGMVGARQGWVEAPYATASCPPPGPAKAATPRVTDPRLSVRILPGVSQASPADVMRGEETQIAGLLATHPQFDGVICLPGTHTKWVRISAGEIVSFQTYMTGELFALLAGHSVLRHTIAQGWDDAAFAAALDDTLARPQTIAAALFNLRAENLLNAMPPATARARASGLLIGLELAGARPYWLGQRVALVGADALVDRYATALGAQGVSPERFSGDAMVLAGLRAAFDALERT